MNETMRLSTTVLLGLVVAGIACGDSGESSSGQSGLESAARPSRDNPGGQTAQRDYGPKAGIQGFRRFEGSCQTFPYNLQYPSSWEVEAAGGISISKTRTDDTRFVIRTAEDFGSVHAANLQRSMIAQGAKEVGQVQVGGQEVTVLNMNDGYSLNTPHGVGSLFHNLAVTSTLGVDRTLQILNTLEPLEAC